MKELEISDSYISLFGIKLDDTFLVMYSSAQTPLWLLCTYITCGIFVAQLNSYSVCKLAHYNGQESFPLIAQLHSGSGVHYIRNSIKGDIMLLYLLIVIKMRYPIASINEENEIFT